MGDYYAGPDDFQSDYNFFGDLASVAKAVSPYMKEYAEHARQVKEDKEFKRKSYEEAAAFKDKLLNDDEAMNEIASKNGFANVEEARYAIDNLIPDVDDGLTNEQYHDKLQSGANSLNSLWKNTSMYTENPKSLINYMMASGDTSVLEVNRRRDKDRQNKEGIDKFLATNPSKKEIARFVDEHKDIAGAYGNTLQYVLDSYDKKTKEDEGADRAKKNEAAMKFLNNASDDLDLSDEELIGEAMKILGPGREAEARAMSGVTIRNRRINAAAKAAEEAADKKGKDAARKQAIKNALAQDKLTEEEMKRTGDAFKQHIRNLKSEVSLLRRDLPALKKEQPLEYKIAQRHLAAKEEKLDQMSETYADFLELGKEGFLDSVVRRTGVSGMSDRIDARQRQGLREEAYGLAKGYEKGEQKGWNLFKPGTWGKKDDRKRFEEEAAEKGFRVEWDGNKPLMLDAEGMPVKYSDETGLKMVAKELAKRYNPKDIQAKFDELEGAGATVTPEMLEAYVEQELGGM